MSKIIKLSDELIKQIAAGEVVERPLNIIKELLENSIDAGATKIDVVIENGGIDYLSVQDNGHGMTKDELELAFELHYTSKIPEGDIHNVNSLGFRGEALASIAAVSRVECSSNSPGGSGQKIIIEAGKRESLSQHRCPTGTYTEIRGLFFNIPARRKFLKKAATEKKRIIELFTHFVLLYPQIHFTLSERKEDFRQKKIIESPARENMLASIYDVLGAETANALVPLNSKIGDWTLQGYISKPIITKKDRSLQYLCVNGRPVRHQELQTSIEKGYGSQLLRSQYPIILLDITGPLDGVDFNIHPQKSEIRFKADDPLIVEIAPIVEKILQEAAELNNLPDSKLENIKKNP
ncbi:MAG: DNA mismatch repair endonuclease MutL [Candidatus Heimdallarchaeota archaeon]|nr:DNA mismatch repair endonuclease MutL [Candidatus Heimdallarchaeota archaeon]MDH5646227.1 DNA mismatch repair endonuclease MutL [Candidatus Heimdallarchaeota archaeon]